MALKVQYTDKSDTNVPGILKWNNQGGIIKHNRWKLQIKSNLGSNDQEFSFITV